jgi:cardiolipin synthase
MGGPVTWFKDEFVPWTRGRMFRTGVPLDQPVVVTDRVFTLPNGITLLRFLGLPLFVYLAIVRHAWIVAFIVLVVSAALDSIDGYIARRFGQSTRLGAAFDPLTDRLTIATIGVTLVLVGVIPVWVVVLIVLRDVLLLALATTLASLKRPVPGGKMPVSRTGKLAMMALMLGLPFLVLARADLLGGSVIRLAALLMTGFGIALYYLALVLYVRIGIAASGR